MTPGSSPVCRGLGLRAARRQARGSMWKSLEPALRGNPKLRVKAVTHDGKGRELVPGTPLRLVPHSGQRPALLRDTAHRDTMPLTLLSGCPGRSISYSGTSSASPGKAIPGGPKDHMLFIDDIDGGAAEGTVRFASPQRPAGGAAPASLPPGTRTAPGRAGNASEIASRPHGRITAEFLSQGSPVHRTNAVAGMRRIRRQESASPPFAKQPSSPPG
jgi:hypothetical protein